MYRKANLARMVAMEVILGRAKGGGGEMYRKAKPCEDGPLEAIFADPPEMVSEEVT